MPGFLRGAGERKGASEEIDLKHGLGFAGWAAGSESGAIAPFPHLSSGGGGGGGRMEVGEGGPRVGMVSHGAFASPARTGKSRKRWKFTGLGVGE